MTTVASRVRDKLKNLESSGGNLVSTSGSKVTRYRAGYKPDYAEEDNDQDTHFSNIQNQKSIKEAEVNDPRLNRFKNRSSETSDKDNIEERKASRRRHHEDDDDNETTTTTTTTTERRIVKTEIIKEDDNNNNEEDDDGDRRKRAKEKYLKNKQIEEEIARQKELDSQPFKDIDEEGEEEGSGSSEYETDSEDDDDNDNEYWNQQPILRPTFVKKEQRGTIKTDEQWEKEEAEKQATLEREKEQKKQEAHRKLKEELDRDRNEQNAKDLEQKQQDDLDNDEDEDGSKFKEWVQREIDRVTIEIKTRLTIEFDKKEKERRRNLTDEQILSEDPSRVNHNHGEKKNLKFMQRDYHRGAFFQDDEYIKNKDFSGTTGQDNFNRELLPKIMQVKNFGKSGQTKYTHLKDQDTSSKDSLWNSKNNNNNKSYNNNKGNNNRS